MDEGFVDEFDLLMSFGWFVCCDEISAARRTGVEFEFDDVVDLRFVEGFAKMLLVSFLRTDFPFLFCSRSTGKKFWEYR
jgi:hypothetical protein